MKFHRLVPLLCYAVLALSIETSAAPLPDIQGRVVGVHDGDTITVLTTGNVQVKVRLEGIDAPESKQAFGTRAKEELSAMVFGKAVRIADHGRDRYKRTLGRVYVGNLDVNLAMVERGFAWRYVAYSKEPALIEAEGRAREQKRGLWVDPSPVPPWEWRKRS